MSDQAWTIVTKQKLYNWTPWAHAHVVDLRESFRTVVHCTTVLLFFDGQGYAIPLLLPAAGQRPCLAKLVLTDFNASIRRYVKTNGCWNQGLSKSWMLSLLQRLLVRPKTNILNFDSTGQFVLCLVCHAALIPACMNTVNDSCRRLDFESEVDISGFETGAT